MQYFTEQAASHREALEMVRYKYGESAQVLSHKTVRLGGFLGFFAREGVEVTGYIRPEKPGEAVKPPRQDFEEEKRKILAQARADQAFQQVLTDPSFRRRSKIPNWRLWPSIENRQSAIENGMRE